MSGHCARSDCSRWMLRHRRLDPGNHPRASPRLRRDPGRWLIVSPEQLTQGITGYAGIRRGTEPQRRNTHKTDNAWQDPCFRMNDRVPCVVSGENREMECASEVLADAYRHSTSLKIGLLPGNDGKLPQGGFNMSRVVPALARRVAPSNAGGELDGNRLIPPFTGSDNPLRGKSV